MTAEGREQHEISERRDPPPDPLLVVDRAALTRNIDRMQALCDTAGVRLRAHGKTHKCSTLGRLIVERGAVGLCAQTVGEAEAFVKGGLRGRSGHGAAADLGRPPSGRPGEVRRHHRRHRR